MMCEEEKAWREDNNLRQKLMDAISQARYLNDGVCLTPLRHKIDDYLTRAYLLARDGNEDKLNGGG